MRVCRHQRVLERCCVVDHYLLKRTNSRIELDASVHRPETRRCCDLVVAATTGVELRRHITDFVVEHAVNESVNVFIRRERLGAAGELLGDRREATLDCLAFLEGENSSAP